MNREPPMEVRSIIERIKHFRDVELLRSLVPQFQRAVYQKGAVLLDQGGKWETAFFVEHGLLRTYLVSEDGKEFSKSFYAEGSLLGPIIPQLESNPAPFSIATLEGSTVWHVHIATLRTCLEAQAIWEPLCVELLGTLFSNKLQREYDLQVLDGKARYRKFCQENPDLARRVPLMHLASYLGLTDVSLSRIRRHLAALAD